MILLIIFAGFIGLLFLKIKYDDYTQNQREEVVKKISFNNSKKAEFFRELGVSDFRSGDIIIEREKNNFDRWGNYKWKKIRVVKYTYEKEIRGIIVDVHKNASQFENSSLNTEIIIDLMQLSNNHTYISENKHNKDLFKSKLLEQEPILEQKIKTIEVKKHAYAKKIMLWKAYYNSFPVEMVGGMSGNDFEKFVFNLLNEIGYKCKMTKTSGDQGVDIVIEDESGNKIAVQTKCYSSKVGNFAIQVKKSQQEKSTTNALKLG